MKGKRLKNEYNRFILIFFILSFILIFLFMTTIIYIDPFCHYHEPIKPIALIPELQKQVYYNVGMAKNLTYDTILTGSSMTENFRISQINQLFDCDAIKLSYPRGRIYHYEILFNEALNNNKVKIKKIFYVCDIIAYIENPDAEIPNKIPEYLYDNNIFTDVKYVLNKTVMFENALPHLKTSIENKVPDIDYAYMWYMWYDFSKSTVLSEYIRPDIEEKKSIDIHEENVKLNCERIGKYIKENPEIEFNIFFPPYSILYYDDFNRRGELEALLYSQEMVAEYLLQFSNVKLSSFFADENIICNLDNYKDYTHYSERINEYIAEKMKTEEYILNKENYKQYFEEAKKLLYNYDYEQLFL